MTPISQQQSIQTSVQKLDPQAIVVSRVYIQESMRSFITPCMNFTLNSDLSIRFESEYSLSSPFEPSKVYTQPSGNLIGSMWPKNAYL